MKQKIIRGDRVIVDGGYRCDPKLLAPDECRRYKNKRTKKGIENCLCVMRHYVVESKHGVAWDKCGIIVMKIIIIHTERKVIDVTHLGIENIIYPFCADGYDDCAKC